MKLFPSIQKLSPKAGDVLMFYIKTDEYGTPMMSLEAVQQTVEMVTNILEDRGDKGVAGLFLMDKICLFSIDSADTAIDKKGWKIVFLTSERQQIKFLILKMEISEIL